MDTNFRRVVEVLQEMRHLVIKKPSHLAQLKFLDRKQAAEYIGMSDFWLEKHCNDLTAPKFFRHGRKCWYARADLDAWIVRRKAEVTESENIWKRGESRRLPSPSEKELCAAYTETWGTEENTPKVDPQDAFLRLVESLSPAQRQLLVSTLACRQDAAEKEKKTKDKE